MKIILEFNSREEHDEYVTNIYQLLYNEKQYCAAHHLSEEEKTTEVTNGEHFKDEIDKMDEAEPDCAKGVDRNTKVPVRCYSIPCYMCLFNGTGNDCSKDFDKWLSQPYKENENVE